MEQAQNQQFQRQVACKIWISNLNNGSFVAGQRGENSFIPSYVQCQDQRVSRINVIGTIVDVYHSDEKNYMSLTFDDGSATIRLKAFNEETPLLEPIAKGDLVLVVARVREYRNELYLLPEIVKKVTDPNFELIRKAELLQLCGRPEKEVEKIQQPMPEGEVAVASANGAGLLQQTVKGPEHEELRGKIMEGVAAADETGAQVDRLAQELHVTSELVEQVMKELLLEGEIYENKPGHFKAL